MESVRKLETSLARWYKQWPHLPTSVASFLGEWAWLLALISAILSALGVITLVAITFFGTAMLSGLGPAYVAAGGVIAVAVIISLAFSILIIYLTAIAIMPLKNKQKKGWDLIYYITLISFVASVVRVILYQNVFGIVWAAIWVLIGGYFLFEVRGYFVARPGAKIVKK